MDNDLSSVLIPVANFKADTIVSGPITSIFFVGGRGLKDPQRLVFKRSPCFTREKTEA